MNDESECKCEINYIKENFYEIDPNILNEIELKTIGKIVKELDHNKNEDKLLCKILRLDDEYKKQLLCHVNYEYVSNEAMKILLSSIDFTIISESFLDAVSIRLSFPIINRTKTDTQKNSNPFSNFIKKSIQNFITIQNFKDFTIFVNDKQIEINSLIATLISPKIKKYIQTDRTCSSFYLNFDSDQIDFFKEFANSLSFFISKEKIDDVDQITIENKFYEYLSLINEMVDNKGISHLVTFFTALCSSEKSALNYACWISMFICLGNFDIAEFLINSLVKSNDSDITSYDDVIKRLHHKEVLKYKGEIEVDISSEKQFIGNKIGEFFQNIADFNEIDEYLWKVISIRLSFDVYTKLDDK